MLVVRERIRDDRARHIASEKNLTPGGRAVGGAIHGVFGPPEEIADEGRALAFQGGAGEIEEEVGIPAAAHGGFLVPGISQVRAPEEEIGKLAGDGIEVDRAHEVVVHPASHFRVAGDYPEMEADRHVEFRCPLVIWVISRVVIGDGGQDELEPPESPVMESIDTRRIDLVPQVDPRETDHQIGAFNHHFVNHLVPRHDRTGVFQSLEADFFYSERFTDPLIFGESGIVREEMTVGIDDAPHECSVWVVW